MCDKPFPSSIVIGRFAASCAVTFHKVKASRLTLDRKPILMGRRFLARDDIDAGRLVAPFALEIPNDFSYGID